MTDSVDPADLRTGRDVRHAARSGKWTQATSGLAAGYTQANLVILPEAEAGDFLRFCQRNPKPCPLLGVSEPGDPHLPALGSDLDVRTDLPRYRIWRDGVLLRETTDVSGIWRDDLVTFAIGCSLSFEAALLAEGIPLRHAARHRPVAMYRTNIACAPAGRFSGPLVVSMRSLSPAHAIRAIQITSRFPGVHGAPVHLGFPERIGIADLNKRDYGDDDPTDPVVVEPGEIPVFWACGVTPQAAIVAAKLEFAITHVPGMMLALDQPDHAYAVF